MFEKYVFGYGSLLLKSSLEKTCPTSEIIGEFKLKNYIRVFNKDAGNYVALNIVESLDSNSFVNGIIIKISKKEEFDKLLIREEGYNIIKSNHKNFELITFISTKFKKFDFNSTRQIQYVTTCLNGAKSQSLKFYEEYLESTDIENIKIKDIDLKKLIEN